MASYIHSHWKMNATGNEHNARQASGIYDLTMVGTVPSTTGKLGLARGVFSAANHFRWAAGGSSATVYDTQLFAVEAWIKTATSGAIQVIIQKGNGTTGWQFQVNTTGTIFMQVDGTAIVTSASSVGTNTWTHVFFAKLSNGTNDTRIYINGSLNAQATDGSTFGVSTADLAVGYDITDSNYAFTGLIDSVAYWSTLPSTWTEIESIISKRYNKGQGKEYGYSPGYIQKSTIADVSGSKLITATRLTRQDATNQNPIIYQRNAVIV